MKNRNIEDKPVNEIQEEPVAKRPEKYIITVTNLSLREAPNGSKIGVAPAGIVMIGEIKDGFGKLADGSGWVNMQHYVRKAD